MSHLLKVVNMCIRKVSTAIDWLLTIWKSDLSDKVKRGINPSCSRVSTILWVHHLDTKKC